MTLPELWEQLKELKVICMFNERPDDVQGMATRNYAIDFNVYRNRDDIINDVTFFIESTGLSSAVKLPLVHTRDGTYRHIESRNTAHPDTLTFFVDIDWHAHQKEASQLIEQFINDALPDARLSEQTAAYLQAMLELEKL